MIKNIIFDLGGVVLGRDFEQAAFHDGPFGFLHGDIPFPQCWKDFDGGNATQVDVAKDIAESTGRNYEEIYDMISEIGAKFNEFPVTVNFIHELHSKGYKLYVLSNMPYEFWGYMKSLDIFTLFDGIVISSTEKMSKPDPRFFQLLINRYGLKPEDTLFVDDKPSNTKAAEELGLHTYVYKPDEQSVRDIKDILSE